VLPAALGLLTAGVRLIRSLLTLNLVGLIFLVVVMIVLAIGLLRTGRSRPNDGKEPRIF